MSERAEIEAYDAETVDVTPGPAGPPVDPPSHSTTFADLIGRADERRPIVPASLRSRAGRHALIVLALAAVSHGAAWQASRVPLYLLRIARWAPRGAWLALWRPLWWARAEEGNWHLRQAAASKSDAETWLRLDQQRMRQSRPRWAALASAATVLAVATLLAWFLAPQWTRYAAATLLVLVFARIGRPIDRRIVEHAFNPARYVRLTAELTRAALLAANAGIKDPAAVKFNREIYRDGPGYTAQVTLPTGVIATDVIDKRDYLSAGFQLPVAQVWPEPVRGAHPGVLGIWVADRPMDRMRQPASPLLTCGALDYWGPIPFGQDVRMRPVAWRLDQRNSLFGGMPGSGKTLAARNVALGAALDPLVRFVISELKGSGDLDPLEPLCIDGMYASGADEAAKQQTMKILYWLDRECERRPPLIRKLAAKGLNRDNTLNRAIAEADPTLFPLVGIFDEVQELLTDPDLGKQAKALLISIVKRGRSQGIHVIPATQRIDKESVPRGVSSNVSNRLCLAVPSHVETDLILGTGAYSRGARPTTFVPPADGDNPWAGWGYLAGRDQPIRASYIDNPTAEQIVARALALRGDAPAVDLGEPMDDRDVLADVIKVFAHTNRPGLQWHQVAELLAEEMPGLYEGVNGDAISAMVRAQDVPSVDVKVAGVVLKGCRRTDVESAIERRQLGG